MHVCAKYSQYAKKDLAADEALRRIPAWRALTVTVGWGHTGMGMTRRVNAEQPEMCVQASSRSSDMVGWVRRAGCIAY